MKNCGCAVCNDVSREGAGHGTRGRVRSPSLKLNTPRTDRFGFQRGQAKRPPYTYRTFSKIELQLSKPGSVL
jgi:hypothetical protein